MHGLHFDRVTQTFYKRPIWDIFKFQTELWQEVPHVRKAFQKGARNGFTVALQQCGCRSRFGSTTDPFECSTCSVCRFWYWRLQTIPEGNIRHLSEVFDTKDLRYLQCCVIPHHMFEKAKTTTSVLASSVVMLVLKKAYLMMCRKCTHEELEQKCYKKWDDRIVTSWGIKVLRSWSDARRLFILLSLLSGSVLPWDTLWRSMRAKIDGSLHIGVFQGLQCVLTVGSRLSESQNVGGLTLDKTNQFVSYRSRFYMTYV